MIGGDLNAHPAHRCPSAGLVSTGHLPALLSNQTINNNNNISSSSVAMRLSWCQTMFSPCHPAVSPERSQPIAQDPPHGAGSARLGSGRASTSRGRAVPAHPHGVGSFAGGRGEKPEQGPGARAKSPSRNQGWQLPVSRRFLFCPGTGT